jgi:hypothetical protein
VVRFGAQSAADRVSRTVAPVSACSTPALQVVFPSVT